MMSFTKLVISHCCVVRLLIFSFQTIEFNNVYHIAKEILLFVQDKQRKLNYSKKFDQKFCNDF